MLRAVRMEIRPEEIIETVLTPFLAIGRPDRPDHQPDHQMD
jgi:phage terminase large subunit-like protein